MRLGAVAFCIALALGVLVAPLVADTQQPVKVPRIGLLLNNTPAVVTRNPRMQAFLQGLRELGWIEGQNVVFERRFAEGNFSQLADLAADLVRLKVDVIVTAAAPAARAAKIATSTIPVVILDPGDPVGTGLVASLARPGGNVTGVTSVAPDLAAKRLQLLKEAAPRISRVAVLFNAAVPPAEIAMKELQAAAQVLGLRIQPVALQGPKGFEEAFRTITQDRVDALVVFPDPLTFTNQELIVNFAAKSRIPGLYGAKEFVEIGGLMSYGPSYPDMFRRGAYYVDRILKGTKPADLPVEQPMKFELVINLKTAKVLGLTIPQSVLIRADQVIQ
jgi:putative ABC transport system substrate-binding protein